VRERARSGPSGFHLLVPRRRRRKEKVANPVDHVLGKDHRLAGAANH
jgi:hypothetical protein